MARLSSMLSSCWDPGASVKVVTGVRSYPADDGVLHSGRMAWGVSFLTRRGIPVGVSKEIWWFCQLMEGFHFSNQGFPRIMLWFGRETTRRSMCSSWFSKRRYAAEAD